MKSYRLTIVAAFKKLSDFLPASQLFSEFLFHQKPSLHLEVFHLPVLFSKLTVGV